MDAAMSRREGAMRGIRGGSREAAEKLHNLLTIGHVHNSLSLLFRAYRGGCPSIMATLLSTAIGGPAIPRLSSNPRSTFYVPL